MNKSKAVLKLFVWKGENTLKNYAPGMVVVSAMDESAAWERLKSADFHIWFWLQTGVRYVFSPDEAAIIDPEDHEPGYPQRPVEYDISQLPVLVVVGGE